MPKTPRNHKAEYARRVAKGAERGLSRSQARGHAKASEAHLRGPKGPISNERVQIALVALRRERSISRAAKEARISPERFRKFAVEHGAIEKIRGKWRTSASLARLMETISRGRVQRLKLPDFATASKTGRFNNAVRRFLQTNRQSELLPFEGEGVRDIAGKFYPFETNPNTLYRLSAGGDASFEQIYRIVI